MRPRPTVFDCPSSFFLRPIVTGTASLPVPGKAVENRLVTRQVAAGLVEHHHVAALQLGPVAPERLPDQPLQSVAPHGPLAVLLGYREAQPAAPLAVLPA